jgi:hypothetical protein
LKMALRQLQPETSGLSGLLSDIATLRPLRRKPACAMLIPLVARGQPVKISVDPQTAQIATLEPFDHSTFKVNPMAPPLSPITLLLVNHSDQDIVALRVIWQGTPNPNTGKPRRSILTSDMFQLPNLKPLTKAHSQTVVRPRTVFSLDRVQGIVAGASTTDNERFPPDQTTATLDAVVLADGSLYGPDTEGLAADLNVRKQAATQVADQLKNSGYSIAALTGAQFTPTSREEVRLANALRDMSDQARNLQVGMTPQAVEAWLRALPAPPRISHK